MQQGRGGMGSTKHGKSGHFTRSPRYKFMQTLEANATPVLKPKPKMYGSLREALDNNKPK